MVYGTMYWRERKRIMEEIYEGGDLCRSQDQLRIFLEGENFTFFLAGSVLIFLVFTS